jgi:hypothetical protein
MDVKVLKGFLGKIERNDDLSKNAFINKIQS